MSDLPDNPMSNVEKYLSALAGESTELPAHPQSRVEQYLAYIAENGGTGGSGSSGTTYEPATFESDGLMSASDKQKLDNIEAQAQKNTITGVKGSNESSYRTGNINITPENIGAADATQTNNQIQLLRELINGIDAPIYRSAGPDNPVILSDGYAAPVKSLSVDIPVTQSGSGDPSPSNIRPISGFSGSVTVTRTDGNETDPQTQTVTVQLTDDNSDPLIIYGGNLNLTTGILTVTHGIVDLGTLAWAKYPGRPNTIVSSLGRNGDYPFGTVDGGIPGCACSAYTPISGISSVSFSQYEADTTKYFGTIVLSYRSLSHTQATLAIKDPELTEDNVQTRLSGIMLVYPKNAPVTYQLTSEEITILAGNNTISSNIGKIDVTYRADPALSLQ